jgi:radical SAM superfamily enzyme YgiQ (UPF0313 family)
MLDVLLTTINAKYIHAAFGLRYLFANLGNLKTSAEIIEFDLQTRPIDMAEAILNKNPKIVGIGVYIWNIREVQDLVDILKRVNPEIIIVLGGPEVSYEWKISQRFKCVIILYGEKEKSPLLNCVKRY